MPTRWDPAQASYLGTPGNVAAAVPTAPPANPDVSTFGAALARPDGKTVLLAAANPARGAITIVNEGPHPCRILRSQAGPADGSKLLRAGAVLTLNTPADVYLVGTAAGPTLVEWIADTHA